MVTKDAQSAKLETEMTAGRCNYEFVNRHEIYSMLRLRLEKDRFLQQIKQHTLMSVVIRE